MSSKDAIELAEKFGAHNYHPLPIVISGAEGVWVEDPEGRKFMDMLSAYSALNQGHRHPKIIQALIDQANKVTLTSRAFHNDQLGVFLKLLCEVTGFESALPMNTGAEAVETAIKAIRKWGYKKKGVAAGKAEIIVCTDNFHGRTTTIVGFSTEDQYKDGFGPFTPGFVVVPFGDTAALEAAFNENTVGFLVEPIQGEAGINVPPAGYMKRARELCDEYKALLCCDEIQTGFGRTGKMFAFEHEGIRPDCVTVGKALGGGVFPVSGFLASWDVMDVFSPGDHGSTFGGNPLGAAVGMASLEVLIEDDLCAASDAMGAYLVAALEAIDSDHVKEVRGRGLLIGVEIKEEVGTARPFCEALMLRGILAKETHHQVIRFAPPLTITKEEIDWALVHIGQVLNGELVDGEVVTKEG
ncbi:MAG: ornithine--oxo-acid transaminase [Proteobacteria bacterium]|nr:ornithine--oxo-acid transaminase [Pseudomonadota bacterium]MCP4917460.1 ornithine--oxo-acid transaminase [Pseudomonadota bacterium]